MTHFHQALSYNLIKHYLQLIWFKLSLKNRRLWVSLFHVHHWIGQTVALVNYTEIISKCLYLKMNAIFILRTTKKRWTESSREQNQVLTKPFQIATGDVRRKQYFKQKNDCHTLWCYCKPCVWRQEMHLLNIQEMTLTICLWHWNLLSCFLLVVTVKILGLKTRKRKQVTLGKSLISICHQNLSHWRGSYHWIHTSL